MHLYSAIITSVFWTMEACQILPLRVNKLELPRKARGLVALSDEQVLTFDKFSLHNFLELPIFDEEDLP